MKRNKPKTNGAKLITIEFDNAVAQAVNIAGSFNDWRPEATDMIPLGNGRWRKQLTLAPGTYEYLFVADGRWIPDPLARESVRNPFGGVNSVLKI